MILHQSFSDGAQVISPVRERWTTTLSLSLSRSLSLFSQGSISNLVRGFSFSLFDHTSLFPQPVSRSLSLSHLSSLFCLSPISLSFIYIKSTPVGAIIPLRWVQCSRQGKIKAPQGWEAPLLSPWGSTETKGTNTDKWVPEPLYHFNSPSGTKKCKSGGQDLFSVLPAATGRECLEPSYTIKKRLPTDWAQ